MNSLVGPTGQPFFGRTVGPLARNAKQKSSTSPQGTALGWENDGPSGHIRVNWTGRTMALQARCEATIETCSKYRQSSIF